VSPFSRGELYETHTADVLCMHGVDDRIGGVRASQYTSSHFGSAYGYSRASDIYFRAADRQVNDRAA